MSAVRLVPVAIALASSCSNASGTSEPRPSRLSPAQLTASATDRPQAGRPMTLHFYDVGEGLSVLVDLPDGRHVLVDAGDSPRREGCGEPCARAHAHLMARLGDDLAGAPIDMMWITHPHSDHVGGAPEVLASVPVRLYVDNGRSARKPEARRAREAAEAAGARIRVVDPHHPDGPLPSSLDVRLSPVVPSEWPRSCEEDENECSIALRIDDRVSSVLLTGDAEHAEEARLDVGGPVTLLQVGHHGSDSSSTPAFLAELRPRYAVISAGKPDEGLNRDYCHPRAIIVDRLSRVLGSSGRPRTLAAFDGARCDRKTPADWVSVPASDRLWATERDGDVVLMTTGDGSFRRVDRR